LIQVFLKINVHISIFLWAKAPNAGVARAATELHGFISRQ